MMKITAPLVVLLLALSPLAISGYQVSILIEILIFSLFAMSLDIQVGYAGMFSFGHAAPYGAGAYVAAIALLDGWSLPLALVMATGAVIVLALPIGWLCTRANGVAFAMLTLAFAQLAFAITFKWDGVTGGSDGLSGLARNPGPFELNWFTSREGYFWLTLAIVVVLFLVSHNFVRSPLGTAIVAVRENEKRSRAIGYNPRLLRLSAFVFSSALAGVAGALHAGFLLFVSPELVHWTLSGQVLIAVVLGGAGTLIGPMVGAAIIVLASHQLSGVTESWQLFMGILFILIVVAAPKGLWGIRSSMLHVYRLRKERALEDRHVAS
ncbi:branched-chain amino acid ABC transporter permease [Rhizobium sp. 2YAF20]|uniref:branched-chain amino acid ABC transporter permease n=1 Tax=Rhizobium sp. 2YAF20 TaxID=3233027 RepID=UPI003F9E3F16